MTDHKEEEAKRKIANAVVQRAKKERWKTLLAILHLHEEDKAERFTLLLALHMMLDRVLTALISQRFWEPRLAADFIKVEGMVNKISMQMRIELAHTAGLISEACAKDCMAVNNVRQNLAHWRRKSRTDGWGLGHVREIASEEAFDRCMERGQRALDELIDKATSDFLRLPTVP
jgi:hypothetical protein